MGAIVKLQSDPIQVVPGAVATVSITVKNTGTVVDQFTLEVLGDAAGWASVDPPTLSLFPDAEGKAVISFAPPRLSTVPAGSIVFGVRAASKEDPAGSTVEERALVVGTFADTFAELLPRTSTGGRSGNHSVAIDNRGNAAVNATISGADPDNLLQIGVQPPGLVVDPGTAAFARVHVSPRKKFWRGQPKTRPFKLQVETPNEAPVTLDGTLLQQAVLPAWLMKALVAALVLALLAALLWFGLFQPAMKSAAQQALVDAGITPTPAAGVAATPKPTPAAVATPTPAPTPTPKVSATPTATPAPLFGGTPTDGRLTANTGTASTAAVAANTTLYITDLVFDNPNGLSGTAKLSRGGVDISVLRLENFRSLDYHFVTPIVVKAGQNVSFTAACTTDPLSTAAPLPCQPSVYYSGFTSP
jgi:hypothetical protein